MLRTGAKILINSTISLLPPATRRRFKRYHELRYWRGVTRPIRSDRAALKHERAHYEHFFTTFFGLTRADYAGKRLLDIGCGPCGSLEWATMAAERIGLDPLADEYRKLAHDDQAMTYCAAPSEAVPFENGHFDSVTAFNCLDHVDDVNRTIQEIKRVVAHDGRVLLIVETGHVPTPTEPHRLDERIVDLFAPEFRTVSARSFGVRADHNLYASLLNEIPHAGGSPGIFCARLERA